MKAQNEVMWQFDAGEASAATSARADFTTYLRSKCTADSDIEAAQIVFSELIANAFQHGVGPVKMWIEFSRPDCSLNVADQGKGFELGIPSLPEDELSENGRGLFLVWALATRVQVIHVPNDGSIVKALLPVRLAA